MFVFLPYKWHNERHKITRSNTERRFSLTREGVVATSYLPIFSLSSQYNHDHWILIGWLVLSLMVLLQNGSIHGKIMLLLTIKCLIGWLAMGLMGSKVDNFLKFWSKHQMQQKILNRIFKIPSHQEQIILSSSMNEKTYLQGFLEGVLEAIQVSSL